MLSDEYMSKVGTEADRLANLYLDYEDKEDTTHVHVPPAVIILFSSLMGVPPSQLEENTLQIKMLNDAFRFGVYAGQNGLSYSEITPCGCIEPLTENDISQLLATD